MKELQQLLLKRMHELNRMIDSANESIKQAPKGSLRISHNKGTPQYYYRGSKCDKAGIYIKKSDRKLAKQLAQKDYANKIKLKAMKEKNTIVHYLNTYHSEDLSSIYYNLPKSRQNLVDPYIVNDETFITQWKEEKQYIKEKAKTDESFVLPEEDAIITELGECVRSKSEKILADKLYMMGIPYVYECPLYLNGYGMVRPDFTVLNIRTRQEYFWEHLGMMDVKEYCEKAIKKIETYEKNEIYSGKSLIVTYETASHPLNTRVIEGIVKEYLV